MGTRGMVGVRIDGKDKLGYNQSDSYRDELGEDVVKFLRKVKRRKGFEALKEQAKALRLVSDCGKGKKPTVAEIETLRQHADTSVSTGELAEWYVLLRELQGDLEGCLKAGYICGDVRFLRDPLFCEWAYVVNLDTGMLEVYKGFQKSFDPKSRYSKRHNAKDAYFGVALVAEFPIDKIPRNWKKQIPADE